MAAIDNAGGRMADVGGGGNDLARRLIAALAAVRAKATPWEWATYGALLVVGGAMRLWDLGSRAVHHDESLHAYYAWKLASGDGYSHDPLMHGPLQFELNAAIFLLFGDSDYTSRLLYAVAGSALILLPLLFRKRLGTLGAIFTSAMLAFSPAMLYFSRFARNDILMAVWVLGLVICLWRYIDEGKARYLHISAGLLALAFATKESAYLITGLLGLYLIGLLLARNAGAITASAGVRVGETATAAAIGRIAGAFWRAITDFKGKRGPAAFLLLLITLTLPLWSAGIGMFQDTPLLSWSNLTFVNDETGEGAIGTPSGGAVLIAYLFVLMLLAGAAAVGLMWDSDSWMFSAVIFLIVLVLAYTTLLTNIPGIGSGMWRSLGYWIVQQDVARGNQPWYYYLVLTPIYEFLPLALSIAAAVYYRVKRQGDAFTLFLLYWAGMTLLLFTIASEKMPWLLVNIALPLIVLAGKFLGDMASGIDWRGVVSRDAIAQNAAIFLGAPVLLFALYRLALFGTGGEAAPPLIGALYGFAVIALLALGVLAARRYGAAQVAKFAAIPAVLLLFALTIRAGATAAYRNGDVPVEMLVYTQTSPDITLLMREFERSGGADEGGLPLGIDSTSGFTWPWAWYLRHSDSYQASFVTYNENSFADNPPDEAALLVHSSNQPSVDGSLQGVYTPAERVRHRWWFPEHKYRGMTPLRFAQGLFDREAWRSVMDYWLFREGVRGDIGSEDAYVYFAPDFPQNFQPTTR